MGMTFKKDLLIAAVIAIAVHAAASLITVPARPRLPLQENKVNRTLEIFFVSTYKEVKKAQPVVKKKKKRVVIKKKRVKRGDTPVRKKAQQVEMKDRYTKPVEAVKVQEKAPEPVVKDIHYVEKKTELEAKREVAADQAEETVKIVEEEKPPEKGPAKEVKTLPAVPRYSENPPPAYPSIARRRGYEGVVMLSVEVLADGSVGELRIKGTSGHSILDRAAVKAVKKWKFKPAFREEVPVPMWVEIPVRFIIK